MARTRIQGRLPLPVLLSAILLAGGLLLGACAARPEEEQPVDATALVAADALPFTLEFIEQTYSSTLPALQSYVAAVLDDGTWLVAGGRGQGLHTFKQEGSNFPDSLSNHYLWVIDPSAGRTWRFDVTTLPDALAAPLAATNQQAYYDRTSGALYLAGGYGWKADKSDMTTFDVLLRLPAQQVADAVRRGAPPDSIAALIEVGQDARFAVTGGTLVQSGGLFYLVFGQRFDGQYRAFSGQGFTQTYTEAVRIFQLRPNTLEVLNAGEIRSSDPSRPFHRRDGNIVESIDPATGQPRIAAFGGVFAPGRIAAYTDPVYVTLDGIDRTTATVDTSVSQRFSQYQAPVIPVYSASLQTTFHTFFGGISHYYFHETAAQAAMRDTVTHQGRNDGFPFVADVTTFLQRADGTYSEYILPAPVPDTLLLGTSAMFLINPELFARGLAHANGTILLDTLPPGGRVPIGYIYGGIEADFPLPKIPNQGTRASNRVFTVYLTHRPSGAIPARYGHESRVSDANRAL